MFLFGTQYTILNCKRNFIILVIVLPIIFVIILLIYLTINKVLYSPVHIEIPDLPLMNLRISSLSLSASEKIAKPKEELSLLKVENILTLIGLKHLIEKVEFLGLKNKLPGK